MIEVHRRSVVVKDGLLRGPFAAGDAFPPETKKATLALVGRVALQITVQPTLWRSTSPVGLFAPQSATTSRRAPSELKGSRKEAHSLVGEALSTTRCLLRVVLGRLATTSSLSG